MSGFSMALLFAYLTVRPAVPITSADGACLADSKSDGALMKVESVQQGDLSAKMHAKNQCASSNGWRVLFGFYLTPSAWKKSVRGIWTRALETEDWEVCVREGLKLSRKHAVGAKVYVSTAARCEPDSPLLSALQRLQLDDDDAEMKALKRRTAQLKEFWKIIMSRKSIKWVKAQLRRELTRELRHSSSVL